MIKKHIITLILITIFLFGAIFSYWSGNNNGNTNSITINDVDSQIQVFKSKQDIITKLKKDFAENTKIIDQKAAEIIILEKKIADVDTQNIAQRAQLEKNKSQHDTKILELSSLQNSAGKIFDIIKEKKQIQDNLETANSEINKQIEPSKIEKSALQTQKTQIEQEIKSLEPLQKTIQQSIDEKNLEISQQYSIVTTTVSLLLSNYVVYIMLLLSYWLIYKYARYLIHKDVRNHTIKSASKLTARILWIALSIITILYGFAGQFAYIFTSLGFATAAIVVALQSFVASFFVFVILSVTKIFKPGDIIKVGASYECYFGKIVSIGRFYTFIKEINNDNHEEMGRTVVIPNNFLIAHPITNYTYHNQVIWQNLKVTVTQNSNQNLVKEILEKIATDKFEMMSKDVDTWLDLGVELSSITPKIIMSIGDKGISYIVHFPCRFNKYNAIYDMLLLEIINAFNQNNIVIVFGE